MQFEIHIKVNEATGVIEISAYGFTAEIRKGIQFNSTTGRSIEVYSLLMENKLPLALSQKSLEEYILFLEYCQFYIQELNS